MSIVTREIPSFVEWAFGPAFAAKLDAIAPECPEARPTAVEGYTPGRYEASFWAGFTLGLDREDAAPPAESTPVEARAFQAGWVAGHREWEKRLDEMFAGPEWAEFSDGVTDLDVHPRGVC